MNPIKPIYDYLILSYIPSFYKINLFNEISKKANIKVLFVSENYTEREKSFVEGKHHYNYSIISKGNIENRNILATSLRIIKEIQSTSYKKLIISGWDLPEFWVASSISPTQKNCLIVESSIKDSSTSPTKTLMKKIFLNRISTAFASSESSKALLDKLSFKGKILITKGVGIINKNQHCLKIKKPYTGSFIFVGRFVQEKNLLTLVKVFNSIPHLKLTLLGDGPLRQKLVKIAKSNIAFHPMVPNIQVFKFLKKIDFLILPSTKEPWGLVVEEALYCGIPVIVSQNCGAKDLITHGENGYIFNPSKPTELKNLLTNITGATYNKMTEKQYCNIIDKKDKHQINSYLRALKHE